MRGDGLDLAEERITARQAKNGMEFDPASIITIITAIMKVLQGCTNPTPRAMRRRMLNRARLASALRQHDNSLPWAQAFQDADELFTLADEAKNEELQLLIDDCCK